MLLSVFSVLNIVSPSKMSATVKEVPVAVANVTAAEVPLAVLLV